MKNVHNLVKKVFFLFFECSMKFITKNYFNQYNCCARAIHRFTENFIVNVHLNKTEGCTFGFKSKNIILKQLQQLIKSFLKYLKS